MENCDWTTVPAGELVSVCAEHRLVKTPSGREFVSCRMVGGCAYTASLEEHPWFQDAFGYPCRLAVYDERGVFVCGVTNHTHHRGLTVVCAFVPPRDCTYYIEARGCAFRLYGPGEDMPESDWPDGPYVEETSAEATDLGDLTGAFGLMMSSKKADHPESTG